MKKQFILYTLLVFIQFSFAQKNIAVIELFTSQGCSSCPPADELLAKTIQNAKNEEANIFALSYHVDYWNRLGWADPFSQKLFSERQNLYANQFHFRSIYTPQMVVNGSIEFVGSSQKELKSALVEAAKTQTKVALKTLQTDVDNFGNTILNYSLSGNYQKCTINIALVSKAENISVKRGENSGKTLHHENVVKKLLTYDAQSNGKISDLGTFDKNSQIIIVFIQQKEDMKIIGAAKIDK